MENGTIQIITTLVTVLNTLLIMWVALKKLKPEINKLNAEEESINTDASRINLEGAKISSTMLQERVEELKLDLAAEKKARRDDAEYFRRRIKDIEKESRDYRLWAARLAKQVIEVGKVPVPFISSLNDSDPLISTITREEAQLKQARDERETQLKNEEEGR